MWSGRFEGYSAAAFRKDLVSGLVVGIIAIPLGMAFAIASGVKPEYGIYTTFIAGILISLLGGSRYQIGGPTGAFIPILFAVVLQYGYENLLIAGFLAGVMLVLMGVLRLGALIQFIPRPVTIGFTAGIAVIIFTGQIADFLGLSGVVKHELFLANMKEIAMRLGTVNLYSVLVAAVCLAALILTPKLLPKVPGSLVGIILSTALAVLFFDGKLETIGSKFGGIPSSLPEFQMLDLSWERILKLLQPAFVIAMLGGIESLLSAVVADGMTGKRHNSNRELIGQGVANMVVPFFGGIPATGAIARTATNIKTGAVSPMSGVIHGVVVLLVLLMFAPYASYIPLASMAPILMMTAWNMSERHEFARILKLKNGDSAVLLITFLLTVFTNLTWAVGFGLLLAILLFVKQSAGGMKIEKVLPDPNARQGKVRPHVVSAGRDCPQFGIFTVEGSLFFGAANYFEKTVMNAIHSRPKVLLLRLAKVPYIDTTGEANLASLVKHFTKEGGIILISGIQQQPLQVLKQSGLYALIGSDRFFAHTGEAIDYALKQIDTLKCKGCRHFAFRECTELSRAEEPAPAVQEQEKVSVVTG